MFRIAAALITVTLSAGFATAQESVSADQQDQASVATADAMHSIQSDAIRNQQSAVAHWGVRTDTYSSWTNHSNRLVPVYTFGITLDKLRDQGSAYRDRERLSQLYGRVPEGTWNPTATYFDQTDVYHLQLAAIEAGYRNIILMVFDGMDWQTTRAAALYHGGQMYHSGRGTGLSFLDERRTVTDFAFICTSAHAPGAKYDVNSQVVLQARAAAGGYDPLRGGELPWHEQSARNYLIGLDRERPHTVTDSASSATSMTAGIKTYNGSINVAVDGTHVVPIARMLQAERDFKIGVVTSVPVSHATPAAAYANNVTRKDYQDLSRDLLGLPSSSHREEPLSGVDVLIGGGWGESSGSEKLQGGNFRPGNPYLHQDDIRKAKHQRGGKYVVSQRAEGKSGGQRLLAAAKRAVKNERRLLGFFGTRGGHLPFRTADGNYDPTFDVKGTEKYDASDVDENPTLAEMTRAALLVLEQSTDGFWLMVEAGDVDWANHANNLDSSIGAVLSGDEAFQTVMDWVDKADAWSETAVILTADHGHFLVIDGAEALIQAGGNAPPSIR